MTWTFPSDVDQEDIEACLTLLRLWTNDDDAGGFITKLAFVCGYSGTDGEDHYVFRTITGEARSNDLVGLLTRVAHDLMSAADRDHLRDHPDDD